jgi:hypothetical protein
MNRRFLSFRIVGAVLIVAGLGLGYGLARWWRPADSSPTTPSAKESSERPQAAEPDPAAAGNTSGRRALLVGVTKYDHVPQARLAGPANDVYLMRQLLQTSYHFPAGAIVCLTEDEDRPERRPIRANIEREFRRLAEQAREGDQVVILLGGHGARQPADPGNREPDGIDEIFLPADVVPWRGFPDKCPRAIVDKELGKWLEAITTKKAYVWIVFDCCHSATMTRGTETPRELQPPSLLVPEEELDRARQRAAQRGNTRGLPGEKPTAFVPREASDYLVALYACRETEQTPEYLQPPEQPDAKCHGLLTYSLVDILTKSAASKAPLTYRELVRRLQVRYAARPQGSPTPQVEGKGQVQVVLGTAQPARSNILLSRDQGVYKINAGDLHGLTTGSVLAVYSPAGTDMEPTLLGHVRVTALQPFAATVEPCEYEKSPLRQDLPPLSSCRPVAIDYGLRRFKVAVQTPDGQAATRPQLVEALEPLVKDGLVIREPAEPEWLVRLEKDKLQLVEASGNRAPFALPGPDSPELSDALRRNLERIFRARNLIDISRRFEEQRYQGNALVDVEVQVLRHKQANAPGEVWERPAGGWMFRAGDFISFRLTNNSTRNLDVTLLIIGSDFQIEPFYPRLKQGEVVKSLKAGETLDTPPPHGQISDEPPFGPECLVVIAAPTNNPPADFSSLAQEGLARARVADEGKTLQSPLGQLLESAMFRTGERGPLKRSLAERHGMRMLTWRTEPGKVKTP